jgi:LysR family transcriptional activator of dmlA
MDIMMGILDDTAIFVAIIQQGGFSHAAKSLGLSNGLISRRIAQLESTLGVTLINRTTRQIHLTPEGELFWQHAQRIQQELDIALSLIQSSSQKPKGTIRISAPVYFGRHFLAPVIIKFLNNFSDIKIELILTNQKLDLIKEHMDLVIRGVGYSDNSVLEDSTMQMKFLVKYKIGLYASSEYVAKHGLPQSVNELANHNIIHLLTKSTNTQERWKYTHKNKPGVLNISPKFSSNEAESCMTACVSGYGIGKFADVYIKNSSQQHLLCTVLPKYNWGETKLFAIYPYQKTLPSRTRLLLDFIYAHIENGSEKITL